MSTGIDKLRDTFSEVQVSFSDFEAFLRERELEPLRENPDRLAQIFLAYACAKGDRVALEHFERTYRGTIDVVRKKFGKRAPLLDDLLADVRAHLFVAVEGKDARILQFSARTDLGNWLKVVVSRLLLNRVAKTDREDVTESTIIDALGIDLATPETGLAKAEARALFRDAFRDAMLELSAREREVLRLVYVEGMMFDEVGTLYGTHRTTAWRLVEQATQNLGKLLRARLQQRLKLQGAEFDRWCASIQASLDLSLRRHLGETPEKG
jgi:RNA polymerase sigma-70 factor, ECF subfamily